MSEYSDEQQTEEAEDEIYATLVEIREEPTALYKILKIANLVSGGGEAKLAISEGYVYLNGEVETQKRKKIVAGDLVYFNEQYLQIALKGALDDYEFVGDDERPNTEYFFEKSDTVETISESKPISKKRKPISF